MVGPIAAVPSESTLANFRRRGRCISNGKREIYKKKEKKKKKNARSVYCIGKTQVAYETPVLFFLSRYIMVVQMELRRARRLRRV